MGVTTANVQRWVQAGIVDEATGARILGFEEAAEAEARRTMPGVSELLSYLAAGIVGVGAIVLVATNWESLGLVARLATTLTRRRLVSHSDRSYDVRRALNSSERPASRGCCQVLW
jgi:uncharacterized membrane protein